MISVSVDGREVGRAADQLRHLRGGPLDHVLRGLAGGDRARLRALLGHVGVPVRRQLAVDDDPLELRRLGREGGLVALELRLPLALDLLAAADALAEVLERLVGDEERLLAGVAVDLLGELDLLVAQRRAVGAVRVLLVRRARGDVGAHDDQRRPVGHLARVGERVLDAVQPDVLAEVLDVPAVGLVAARDVLGERQRGVALDRDVVVVPERDQPPEAEVAGERGGLGRDALLEVAVGGDHVRVVVDDVVTLAVEALGQHALGERHADGGRDALPERPGRGLDTGRVAVLRVPGGRRVELAEVLEVVERQPVARQVQRRVQEHRRVPAAEHEAIAVRPVGLARRMVHHPRVQDVGERREGHRRARMPGVRLLHRVHGQGADRVDAELVEGGPIFCDGQRGPPGFAVRERAARDASATARRGARRAARSLRATRPVRKG